MISRDSREKVARLKFNSSEICTGFSDWRAVFWTWPEVLSKLQLHLNTTNWFLFFAFASFEDGQGFSFHPQSSVWIERGFVECDRATTSPCKKRKKVTLLNICLLVSLRYCANFFSPSLGFSAWLLEETTIFQVFFDYDVGYSVKHKLHVLCVCCTGHVRVDFFDVSAQVQV